MALALAVLVAKEAPWSAPCPCCSLTLYELAPSEAQAAAAMLGHLEGLTALSLGLHACDMLEAWSLAERVEVRCAFLPPGCSLP